ncbi:MAG: CRISPR-associated endonuclease Cas2 [ANME-2 cluster archaeon]|nr:CRISPR-associated endonuclease Cas2 [ANME-2 cluster archaeon]MBC2747321.1 CRISPR-associated endonuclease Cas2 [ANME-2 cluster archaeon]
MMDYGKRWQNILLDHGVRVQYSVFECLVDAKTLDKLVVMLSPFTEGSDSIRFYQICEACLKKMVLLGSGEVTEEVTEEVLFHLI